MVEVRHKLQCRTVTEKNAAAVPSPSRSLDIFCVVFFVERQVSAAVREVAPSLAKDEFTDVAVSYVASICTTLMNLKQTSDEEWAGVGELLGLLVKDLPADANATLKTKCADMMVAEPEDDDDEDAEELCNCQFTLAYGKRDMSGSPRCCALEVRRAPSLNDGAP